jgi:hypothetical protein
VKERTVEEFDGKRGQEDRLIAGTTITRKNNPKRERERE